MDGKLRRLVDLLAENSDAYAYLRLLSEAESIEQRYWCALEFTQVNFFREFDAEVRLSLDQRSAYPVLHGIPVAEAFKLLDPSLLKRLNLAINACLARGCLTGKLHCDGKTPMGPPLPPPDEKKSPEKPATPSKKSPEKAASKCTPCRRLEEYVKIRRHAALGPEDTTRYKDKTPEALARSSDFVDLCMRRTFLNGCTLQQLHCQEGTGFKGVPSCPICTLFRTAMQRPEVVLTYQNALLAQHHIPDRMQLRALLLLGEPLLPELKSYVPLALSKPLQRLLANYLSPALIHGRHDVAIRELFGPTHLSLKDALPQVLHEHIQWSQNEGSPLRTPPPAAGRQSETPDSSTPTASPDDAKPLRLFTPTADRAETPKSGNPTTICPPHFDLSNPSDLPPPLFSSDLCDLQRIEM